ncbi:FliM/FliN family flagellar motor switch protein [Rheinheimera riviphila]|uniref:FliM/FliN family flagellar motor switch protein n=1 Tax=Rheinheimera riviphila TaxID=1834037 RepID=A0A437QRD2_9GAMM|nr:FliM/FliN family flagellar motor C-terminal domain-containing protein [Rheinheimera riviphila]RVU37065.1 FliM/FliN family flagellar motor switch protein [Rheinheimera riviphila]
MSKPVSAVEYSKVDAAPSGDALLPVDLGLVGDVEVQLTGHIGQCTMSVATLYALKKGDIIGLGADIDQPIELSLHGKVVARGRLVAQDGKFALEVTEVASDVRIA